MKITTTKIAAASFGAALASLYSAPDLNAQVDIDFGSDTVPLFPGNYATNVPTAVDFLNVTSGAYAIPGVANAAVGVFNDSFGVGIFATYTGFNGGIRSLGLVEPGDFFTAGSTGRLVFSTGQTGLRYIGFVAGGGAGWFSINLGIDSGPSPTDDLVFVDGQFNQGITGAAGIQVPNAVPEPSSVGLTALALGAIGIRRRRKAIATAA